MQTNSLKYGSLKQRRKIKLSSLFEKLLIYFMISFQLVIWRTNMKQFLFKFLFSLQF